MSVGLKITTIITVLIVSIGVNYERRKNCPKIILLEAMFPSQKLAA